VGIAGRQPAAIALRHPIAVRLSEDPAPGSQSQLRDKLEGEAKALSFSWRTARLAIYAAFGIGGLAGLSSAVPAMLSGQRADGGDGVVGVVVDVLTVLAAIAGAVVDTQAASKPASKPRSTASPLPDWGDSGGLRVQLRLSDREIKPATLDEVVRGARQTVVLLGGGEAFLRQALVSARFDGELFRSSDVLLVPIDCTPVSPPTRAKAEPGSESGDAFARMMAAEEADLASAAGKAGAGGKKGFGKGIASSTWTAAPYVAEVLSQDAPEWARRMRVEADSAAAQGADPKQGVVLVLGTDGAVAQRRIGTPSWRQFLVEIKPDRFDAQERRQTAKKQQNRSK
jgi:hypothetical protein